MSGGILCEFGAKALAGVLSALAAVAIIVFSVLLYYCIKWCNRLLMKYRYSEYRYVERPKPVAPMAQEDNADTQRPKKKKSKKNKGYVIVQSSEDERADD